jgi:hypothetical protein
VSEQFVTTTPQGDLLFRWFWVDQTDRIIGCARCVDWFDFTAGTLPASQVATLKTEIMNGLGSLSDASVATDARTKAALRSTAMGHFTTATHMLTGGMVLGAGPIGYYDPGTKAMVATSTAWLAAADQDIVNGITDLQYSIAGPDPVPWLPAAVAAFDRAFTELSTKQVARR